MKKILIIAVLVACMIGCAFNPRIKENNGDSEFVEVVLFEW